MLKPVSIGAEVPDFFAYDSTGKKVSVKDFRGKYLLIDFWASWCQPCRKDHVVLNNIYKELQESDFEILGVSIEKDRTKWLEALKVDNTPWVNIFADEEADTIVKKFHIQSVPHSLLVDKNGKIIAKNVRAFNLKAKLQQARNQ
jgi:peroxiredoxin